MSIYKISFFVCLGLTVNAHKVTQVTDANHKSMSACLTPVNMEEPAKITWIITPVLAGQDTQVIATHFGNRKFKMQLK